MTFSLEGEEPCGVCPAQPGLPAEATGRGARPGRGLRLAATMAVALVLLLPPGARLISCEAALRGEPCSARFSLGTSLGWPVTKCAPRSSRQQLRDDAR